MFKSFLVSIIFLFSGSVGAALQASNGRETLILSSLPCSNKAILALVPVQYKELMLSATYFSGNKTLDACFTPLPGDMYGIAYEDGDMGVVPVSAFREKGV